jgi:GNAT superfamily N-acetyltransferase
MNRTQTETGFRVAAASAADAGRISDFIAGLSVRTQFLRFFAAVARPSSGLLRALTGARGRADVLIATDGCGAVIGHAMAADRTAADGRHIADLGLVVADGWQGRGVGSALLARLAERAAGRGTDELVMDVLPANTRMLAIAGRRWPDARREYNGDSVTIRAPLRRPAGPAPASAPVPVPAAAAAAAPARAA